MKKIMMVLVLTIIAAGAVFAGGNQENRQADMAPGQGPVLQGSATGTTEEVSLTGTLVMKDGFLVLSAGDDLYSLGGRGIRLYIDDFEEGDVVEVEGTMITDCTGDCDRDLDGHIFLEKVTMDGEEYTFAAGGGNGNGNRRGSAQASRGQGRRGGKSSAGTGNRWSEV